MILNGLAMFQRILHIDLPKKQSTFLWGARQTGKSSFLKMHFNDSVYYDLLQTHEMLRLTASPQLLREEVLALPAVKLKQPIIIDEVQKVPELLDEIHWLIENAGAQFILCGSSARKLKNNATNLLGGRAWVYYFYPLVFPEIPKFNLLKALQHGLIPRHYLSSASHLSDHLQAYVDVYLAEEIRNEGLVRNLRAFSQFLGVAGLTNGEMINTNNIARDCGIDRVTVQGYYQILVDTLIGYHVYPYSKKIKRDLIMATPKFYLFDVAIANFLAEQSVNSLKGAAAGKSFEHFIFLELKAYIGIKRKRIEIYYWRTKSGLEVDFILGKAQFAIEVKLSEHVHQEDLRGLLAFCEEHPKAKAYAVSLDLKPRLLQVNENFKIHILPWKQFLEKLWAEELF